MYASYARYPNGVMPLNNALEYFSQLL
jgi:serine/threonine protein kinase